MLQIGGASAGGGGGGGGKDNGDLWDRENRSLLQAEVQKFLRNVNVWNEKLGFIWMLLDICLSMALIISSNTKMMLLQLGVMF